MPSKAAVSTSVQGVTFTWPEKVYVPQSAAENYTFAVDYKNNSSNDFYYVGFSSRDELGVPALIFDIALAIKAGTSGSLKASMLYNQYLNFRGQAKYQLVLCTKLNIIGDEVCARGDILLTTNKLDATVVPKSTPTAISTPATRTPKTIQELTGLGSNCTITYNFTIPETNGVDYYEVGISHILNVDLSPEKVTSYSPITVLRKIYKNEFTISRDEFRNYLSGKVAKIEKSYVLVRVRGVIGNSYGEWGAAIYSDTSSCAINSQSQAPTTNPLIPQTINEPSVPDLPINQKQIYLTLTSTSGLPLKVESEDDSICSVFETDSSPDKYRITLRKQGSCLISFFQPGDSVWAKSEVSQIDFSIVAAKKITITCTKQSISKKVTSVSPNCPSGYTRRYLSF